MPPGAVWVKDERISTAHLFARLPESVSPAK